jgi:Spy/CpxP family protein refolding chaperone
VTAVWRSLATVLAVIALVVGITTYPVHAQRGGRGGGSSGGEFGGFPLSRFQILSDSFALTKDQKKSVKTLLDDAHKGAAGTRDALLAAHAAIGAAIAGNKGQPDIDAAVKEYGRQAAAMSALEMKTLAQLLLQLDPEQRANQSAVRSAFFLMRGIFLDPKKWDAVPDSRSY